MFSSIDIPHLTLLLWHEMSLETKQCVKLNQFETRIKNLKAEEWNSNFGGAMWLRLDKINSKGRA